MAFGGPDPHHDCTVALGPTRQLVHFYASVSPAAGAHSAAPVTRAALNYRGRAPFSAGSRCPQWQLVGAVPFPGLLPCFIVRPPPAQDPVPPGLLWREPKPQQSTIHRAAQRRTRCAARSGVLRSAGSPYTPTSGYF